MGANKNGDMDVEGQEEGRPHAARQLAIKYTLSSSILVYNQRGLCFFLSDFSDIWLLLNETHFHEEVGCQLLIRLI